jgi:hypothetical protein
VASKIATQQNSGPECGYQKCNTHSRGVPQRVRYEVENVDGCTGVVQTEQCIEVTINKILTVHDQYQE